MSREFYETTAYMSEGARSEYFLSRLPEYLQTSRQNKNPASGKGNRDDWQLLAGYQRELAEFVLEQQHPQAVKDLWVLLRNTAGSNRNKKMLHSLQRGVLRRVAVFRALDNLKQQPQLSSGQNDILAAIDLWAYDQPIQVKSANIPEPRILNVDDQTIASDDKLYGSLEYFRRGLKKYSEHVHPVSGGYLINVPVTMFNQGTGEPRPELVEFLRKQLGLAERAKHAGIDG